MNTLRIVFLITVVAVAGGGCVPGGALYVDSRFTAEERVAIAAAAEMWGALGHPVDLVWDAKTTGRDGSRRELVRAGHRAAIGLHPAFRDEGVDGHAHDGTLVIDVDRIAELGDNFRAVVAHEMGHMLGLRHVPGRAQALMAEVTTPASPHCLTEVDVRHMCAELGCPEGVPAVPSCPER